LLLNAAALGLTQFLPPNTLGAEATPNGYVLAPGEGEHLIHFRDRGNIFIRVGAATGSPNLAVGTQQVMRGTGIPIHRHFKMDESFYVLEGNGILTLNDVSHSFVKDSTLYIPRNTWHGFSNPDSELLLLWIVTPAASLDSFFRETCSPPGAPPKNLSPAQIRQIALSHDTEFR